MCEYVGPSPDARLRFFFFLSLKEKMYCFLSNDKAFSQFTENPSRFYISNRVCFYNLEIISAPYSDDDTCFTDLFVIDIPFTGSEHAQIQAARQTKKKNDVLQQILQQKNLTLQDIVIRENQNNNEFRFGRDTVVLETLFGKSIQNLYTWCEKLCRIYNTAQLQQRQRQAMNRQDHISTRSRVTQKIKQRGQLHARGAVAKFLTSQFQNDSV